MKSKNSFRENVVVALIGAVGLILAAILGQPILSNIMNIVLPPTQTPFIVTTTPDPFSVTQTAFALTQTAFATQQTLIPTSTSDLFAATQTAFALTQTAFATQSTTLPTQTPDTFAATQTAFSITQTAFVNRQPTSSFSNVVVPTATSTIQIIPTATTLNTYCANFSPNAERRVEAGTIIVGDVVVNGQNQYDLYESEAINGYPEGTVVFFEVAGNVKAPYGAACYANQTEEAVNRYVQTELEVGCEDPNIPADHCEVVRVVYVRTGGEQEVVYRR